MAYPFRWTEKEVRDLVTSGDSVVNGCKNQLYALLQQAATVTMAELDRLGATQEQKDFLVAQKAKYQAVYDEIVAQGF